MTNREEVIATLTEHLDHCKEQDEGERIINALTYAIESLKVDLAYDLAYEKVDFIETPEGATNGDMIKAMFSDCKDWKATIEESDEEVYEVHFVHLPNSMTINKYEESWWNAPYKAESGDKKC